MRLDLTQPVDLKHQLAQRRAGWWYVTAGSGGRKPNIMRASQFQGELTGAVGWESTGRGDFATTYAGGSTTRLTAFASEISFVGRPYGAYCWIRTSTTNGTLFSHIGTSTFSGFEFAVARGGPSVSPGLLSLWNGSAWASGNTRVDDGRWHRVGFHNDGTTTRFYLDGRPDGAVTHAGHNACEAGLWIATRNNSVLPYTGSLGDLVIYSGNLIPPDTDYVQSLRGYRTTDSPLRWIRGTAFGLPLGGGGGGSVRIPRFILQTRRRLTGVS